MIGITGITGTLGYFLALELSKKNIKIKALVRNIDKAKTQFKSFDHITFVSGDLDNLESLDLFFHNCEIIIHCAALVSFRPIDKNLLYQINYEGTKTIVHYCQKHKISKLVYISSIAAIGREAEILTINENTKWTESSVNSHYAKSKYLAELEVWRGSEEGLNVSIVNPSVILAPGDITRSSNAIFKTINDGLSIYPSGSINIVDVRDVVDSVIICMNKEINAERYIINGATMLYKDFFESVAKNLSVKPPHIKLNEKLALFFYYLLFPIRNYLNNKLITAETIKNTSAMFVYDNQKSIKNLSLKYRESNETIDWVCNELKQKNIF